MMQISMLMIAHTYRVYCVAASKTVLTALHMRTHFSVITTPGGYYYYPRFTEEQWPREVGTHSQDSPWLHS